MNHAHIIAYRTIHMKPIITTGEQAETVWRTMRHLMKREVSAIVMNDVDYMLRQPARTTIYHQVRERVSIQP